jgi:hypothetical protein
MAMKRQWWWCSVEVALERREGRRRVGRHAVEDVGASVFYRGWRGVRWWGGGAAAIELRQR